MTMRSELLIVSKEATLVAISCLYRMQITKRLYYCEKVPS
jgi:hypothetical protein